MVETVRNRFENAHQSQSRTQSERHATQDTDLVQDMSMEQVRARLERAQSTILRDVDNRLTSVIDEIVSEISKGTSANSQFSRLFSDDKSDTEEKRKQPRNGILPAKEFKARNSLLTDLVEVKHIQTIYHIHIVAVIIMFLNCFVHDFVGTGQINLGINPVIKGFKGIKLGFLIWLVMQTVSILVYPTFQVWAGMRQFLPKGALKPLDYLSALGVVGYIFTFGYAATLFTVTSGLGPATRVALFLEMTRFLMKTYAFVRSNVPRARNNTELPPFKHYIYFLFCPTMIYRDNYPRNKFIRWRFVLKCYLEVLGVILYMSFTFERYVIPVFRDVGATQINSSEFALQIFGCMMPAILIFLSGFYLLLHAWMNAAAEMLRFADRQFYTDWWSATSFPEYYRKWNVVVHDWLYTYVYKDVYENVFRGNKTAAMLMVFTISSLVHEYVLAFTFGFFYPVMLVLFQGCGVLMMFFTNKRKSSFGNIFMWFGIITGNALMLSLYNMEYHARLNCRVGDSVVDYFVPVSWSCHGITTNPVWKVQF